jgi:hypothetical protein
MILQFNFTHENNIGDAVVAGWGTTETGRLPYELHKVTVPLVDNTACEGSYGNQIDSSMICAGIVSYHLKM